MNEMIQVMRARESETALIKYAEYVFRFVSKELAGQRPPRARVLLKLGEFAARDLFMPSFYCFCLFGSNIARVSLQQFLVVERQQNLLAQMMAPSFLTPQKHHLSTIEWIQPRHHSAAYIYPPIQSVIYT